MMTLCFIVERFIPESPRWLVQKGHIRRAKKILEYIAHTNKKTVPNLEPILTQILVSHYLAVIKFVIH